MMRVESENTRLRHYLARLHRKTLCYSKSVYLLKYSIRLLLHYLKYRTVPVQYRSVKEFSRQEWTRRQGERMKFINLIVFSPCLPSSLSPCPTLTKKSLNRNVLCACVELIPPYIQQRCS